MSQIILNGVNLNELLEKIGQVVESKLQKCPSALEQKKSPKFLTRKEVASILNVTLSTLHDWTKLGWIQCYKVGRRVLYKESEVFANVEKLSLHKHKKGSCFPTIILFLLLSSSFGLIYEKPSSPFYSLSSSSSNGIYNTATIWTAVLPKGGAIC